VSKDRLLSDAEKVAMTRATHDMALAMIDDFQYMRETLNKSQPTAGDVRRMGNVLRRILIDKDGDIRKVAPPRIGRIELMAPDTRPLEKTKELWDFLALGKAKLFGAGIGNIAYHHGIGRRIPKGFDGNKVVLLRLDGFLSVCPGSC
jgi:hypothetical protein